MEQHEREYLLNKILYGYIKFRNLKIYYPYGDTVYEGSVVYNDEYNRAVSEGIMTDEDMKWHMIDEGMWSEEKEKQLMEILPKHIEEFKKDLFKAVFKSEERRKIRKYLTVAKEEFARLNGIRNAHYQNTCHGVASYARIQYYISHSTYLKDKLYRWKNDELIEAVNIFQRHTIDDGQIRDMVRNYPWNAMWGAGKKIKDVFGRPVAFWSNEQIRLVTYSIMYDNIHEHQECPPDEVIADDDMLDGWMLIQKEKRKTEMNQAEAHQILGGKLSNADEVYVVAETFEDAQKIDSFNSPQARSIKKRREKILQKEGQMLDVMFPDMKQRYMIEANAYMQRSK